MTEDTILYSLLAFLGMFWLFFVALGVFSVIVKWKIFKKAGREGWESIIPIYSNIVLLEIIGYKWYYIFVFCLSAVPFVGWIAVLIFTISYNIKFAKSFGKETSFGIGLWLLPLIFQPILAFSKKVAYTGKSVNGDLDFNDMF